MSSGDLALGATSTISGNQQQQQQQNPLELLKKLIAQRGAGAQAPLEGGLVNFQPTGTQVPPQARFGTPDIKYANRPGGYGTTGERKRDEKQALFHGIASVVRTAGEYEQQKQVRQMSMDTERMMAAIQGFNEAQERGDTETAKHNSDIANSMFDITTSEGKKRVKAFQKALNVNLIGESKDKDSVEYKGLIEGYKKFYAAKSKGEAALNPVVQKLAQSQPQTLQLSPEAKAQIEAVKGGIRPSANVTAQSQSAQNVEFMRASSDLIKEQMAAASAEERAKMTAGANEERTKAYATAQAARTQAYAAAMADHNATLRKISADRMALLKANLKDKSGIKIVDDLNKTATQLDKRIKDNDDRIKALQATTAKEGFWKSYVDTREKKAYNAEILKLGSENQVLKQQSDSIDQKLQVLQKYGIVDAPSPEAPAPPEVKGSGTDDDPYVVNQ